MKAPLTLVLFFALIGGSYAQTAHKTLLPNCKYYKGNPNPEKGAMGIEPGARCPVCYEKDKKEQEAKRAEDKRRAEIAAAKAKAEQEARDRARAEEELARQKERERKIAEEIRLKKEAEEAKRRLDAIRNQYAKGGKGSSVSGASIDYIEEITDFYDNKKRVYGIKLQDSVVFSKPYPDDVETLSIWRIGKSNYFAVSYTLKGAHYSYDDLNNHERIMNMYGEIVKIDGIEWFYEVSFDSEKNTLKMSSLEQSFTRAHSERLSYGWDEKHETPVYNSLSELLTVHESLVEAADAAFRAKYSKGQTVIVMSPEYVYAAKGVVLKTDLNLKVLEKQSGIVYMYSSSKYE